MLKNRRALFALVATAPLVAGCEAIVPAGLGLVQAGIAVVGTGISYVAHSQAQPTSPQRCEELIREASAAREFNRRNPRAPQRIVNVTQKEINDCPGLQNFERVDRSRPRTGSFGTGGGI